MLKPILACLLILGFILILVPFPAYAHTEILQDATAVLQILSGINAARIANGLTPYALNPLLTQAAQAHSEYQRDTGQVTHDGPGGTRAINRVQAVGYPAVRANENIYAGMVGPQDAVNWWLGSTAGHVQNILHESLREIGVGAASSPDGVIYYTVVFSAQPNVLPIFINNDAYSVNTPAVTLALTNEDIFSGSAGNIGHASQIMVSNTSDFANAASLPWAKYVNWTMDTGAGDGLKTVYIRFIDAAGRTADAQDSIVLDTSGGGAAIVPTPLPTIPPQPTEAALQQTTPEFQPTVILTITPIFGLTDTSMTQLPQRTTITPTRHSYRMTVTPETFPIEIPTTSTKVLGMPVELARSILLGALVLGVVCVALGSVDLMKSRRRAPEGEETDATD